MPFWNCRFWVDFVAKVGERKNEAIISMSLARLRRPLHLAALEMGEQHLDAFAITA